MHPEYSPGQLEVSVGVAGPVAAADRVVLVRDVIRTVARELGPARVAVGQAARRTRSATARTCTCRCGAATTNLFGTGDDGVRHGAGGAGFLAGILAELPALFGVVCASPVSFLRLGPSRWTGVYGCWGVENREAPLRLIQGLARAVPAPRTSS